MPSSNNIGLQYYYITSDYSNENRPKVDDLVLFNKNVYFVKEYDTMISRTILMDDHSLGLPVLCCKAHFNAIKKLHLFKRGKSLKYSDTELNKVEIINLFIMNKSRLRNMYVYSKEKDSKLKFNKLWLK